MKNSPQLFTHNYHMTHILHHLRRRNRGDYSSHERWGVFAGLLLVTLAVSAGGWLLFGKPASSANSLAVSKVELSANSLPVGSLATGYVTIDLANKETNTPQAGVWVGLKVADTVMQTPEFTYFGWYSPETERSFFQTDKKGEIKIPLKSQVAGSVHYQIFTANPELANDGKYQSLDYGFSVEYKASDKQ
jgi:hypothetical protein